VKPVSEMHARIVIYFLSRLDSQLGQAFTSFRY